MIRKLGCMVLAGVLAVGSVRAADMVAAGDPQAITLSLYDGGFALVQELRRLTLGQGDNEVVVRGVPATLDPATTAFTVTAGAKPVDLLEQSLWTNGVPAPELRWLLRAAQAGPSTLRVTYRAESFGWQAAHELTLDPAGTSGRYSCRVALNNQSGRDFTGARLRLVLSERGLSPKIFEAQTARTEPRRFVYGGNEAVADRSTTGPAPLQTYEMEEPVDLPSGPTKYVTFATSPKLAVRRVLVYDGVRFDRFQRNPHVDWNYGTEAQGVVDTYVEFDNDAAAGLNKPLPPGRLRVLRQGADDSLDLVGEARLAPVTAGATARIRVGPAQGLRGERERTGYSEIRPMHEYEETFEIRLANDSADTANVRVVEHLYRGADFDIVKADMEYRKNGTQAIESDVEVKPGAQRSIHYTVRYRW